MSDRVRLPVEIEIHPFLQDHRSEGKGVLPAVEAMQMLAASAQSHWPDIDVRHLSGVSFPRFLFLPPGAVQLRVWHELERDDQRKAVTARLLSLASSRTGRFTRFKEHAVVDFQQGVPAWCPPSPEVSPDADEGSFVLTAASLYRDLVPLGPAYRNARDPIVLCPAGVVASVAAPASEGLPDLLGSPFPLDAAMHCACAWIQRYLGFVGFPTGFDRRVILQPTRPGETYLAKVAVRGGDAGQGLFDIGLWDGAGILREATLGVRMKDVTAGRVQPPSWILRKSSA